VSRQRAAIRMRVSAVVALVPPGFDRVHQLALCPHKARLVGRTHSGGGAARRLGAGAVQLGGKTSVTSSTPITRPLVDASSRLLKEAVAG
jgi:hypothetical protein